ncbi:hypothetical protein [Mesobacillus subterraneus]|nr:hypothetical protein [Mesobacillus subterraneus]
MIKRISDFFEMLSKIEKWCKKYSPVLFTAILILGMLLVSRFL